MPDALIYAEIGDSDAALERLETAFSERDVQLPFLQTEPAFDKLRSDARYKDLLRQMRLA